MWAEHLFFGLRSDLRRRAETTACRLLRGMKIPLLRLSGGSRSCSANLPIGSLSDTNEEVALIRRFARNYDISFRYSRSAIDRHLALTRPGPRNF